jgi:hypothetical protein
VNLVSGKEDQLVFAFSVFFPRTCLATGFQAAGQRPEKDQKRRNDKEYTYCSPEIGQKNGQYSMIQCFRPDCTVKCQKKCQILKISQIQNPSARAVRACGLPNPTNSLERSARTLKAVETDRRAVYTTSANKYFWDWTNKV